VITVGHRHRRIGGAAEPRARPRNALCLVRLARARTASAPAAAARSAGSRNRATPS
jgi:hypothetical protein